MDEIYFLVNIVGVGPVIVKRSEDTTDFMLHHVTTVDDVEEGMNIVRTMNEAANAVHVSMTPVPAVRIDTASVNVKPDGSYLSNGF